MTIEQRYLGVRGMLIAGLIFPTIFEEIDSCP